MRATSRSSARACAGGRRERVSPWLLLLAFFAEDVFPAILDALALVRLGLAPAADLGRDLPDLLLVDAADLDRVLVGSFHVDAFGQRIVHVMAVAELQTQVAALGLGAIADAGDLEHLGEPLGHTRDEVLHVRARHAPRGAVALRVRKGGETDLAFADLIFHKVVEQLHRQRTLRSLNRQGLSLDVRCHAGGHRNRSLANAGHQNTSASTSPPTFWSRASASDSTPRGVDTITVPTPLRLGGRSGAPEVTPRP